RVLAVNAAGTLSELSNQVSAGKDSLVPKALHLNFAPGAATPYESATARCGRGAVKVTLEMSEPLLAEPFLTLNTSGGSAINVQLYLTEPGKYQGTFVITQNIASGNVTPVLSARDAAGNRGTVIDQSDVLVIDTAGPEVISFTPSLSVIKNVPPTTLAFVARLSEPVSKNAQDQLVPPLFGTSVAGETLSATVTAGADELTWNVQFPPLPSAAGQPAEMMTLTYSASDSFGNVGSQFTPNHTFQVYKGTLPPLGIPQGLNAKALPGGSVKLTWQAVEGASTYRIYRKNSEAAAYTAPLSDFSGNEFTDSPAEDGAYWYTVASIRDANGEVSESPFSPSVTATADRVPPLPPTNLALSLQGLGLHASWTAPQETGLVYSLYRSNGPSDKTAVATHLGVTSGIDPTPDSAKPYYYVTSFDAAGNESAPSASVYNDKDLFPVRNLTITRTDDLPPKIAWSRPPGVVTSFDV
ncbi:MAG: hypothetical protein V4710_05520, partial [Verrucomicrobiota bacterium]